MAEVSQPQFDSLLVLSFGGPEGRDDVIPFLENVLRGRNVPRERMLEVAEHYYHFDGTSPINAQNRRLIAAIKGELQRRNIDLPIYWGNRNWHPLLTDTLRQMVSDGRRQALAFFTSIFSSYSGCRQYRENIAAAQKEIGPDAPQVQKVRMGFNHPQFIAAQSDLLSQALAKEYQGAFAGRVLFTAHSIPNSMAENCRYVDQLNAAADLIAKSVGVADWELVFQSRSGPPTQPWLEPDVCERIEQLAEAGVKSLAIVPLGFISDHMEVLYDLDTEAADACKNHGIQMVRVPTVGVHPNFIRMIVDLVEERLFDLPDRPYLGCYGASHDVCPMDCCLPPRARTTPSA